MDLRCPTCSEPWENDTLHDVADELGTSYKRVALRFRSQGCEALGSRHNGNQADPAIGMLYELLGDDMDGVAALIEDFGL